MKEPESDRHTTRQTLLQALKPLWYKRFLIGSSFLLVMLCVVGQAWSTSTQRATRLDRTRQEFIQSTLKYFETLTSKEQRIRLRATSLPLPTQEVYRKINHAYLYAHNLDAQALIREQRQLVVQLHEQMQSLQQETPTPAQLQLFEARLARLEELNTALLEILNFAPHEVMEQFWGLRQIQMQAGELANGYAQVLNLSMTEVQGLYLSLAQGLVLTRLQAQDIETQVTLEMLFQYATLAALSVTAAGLVLALLRHETQLFMISLRNGKAGEAAIASVSVIGQLNYFLPEEYVAELAARYQQLTARQRPIWIAQLITFCCFLEMLWAFYLQSSVD